MSAPRAPWRIEREDRDGGDIDYHIWSVEPVKWLFTIYGRDHANAKEIAERVVASVNASAIPA